MPLQRRTNYGTEFSVSVEAFTSTENEILGDDITRTYPISDFYSHQYMTNIQDPSSQSGMLMEYYTNNGLLNSNLTFVNIIWRMSNYGKKVLLSLLRG